ncbi:MAG: DEAD/DEAH box helicase, partial [Deltaproteobacteria bacterium]|nr:DEAD/DEAH box helicase [Deltaproteobacteria bacterium]
MPRSGPFGPAEHAVSKFAFSSSLSPIEGYVQGLIQDRDLGPDVVAHRIVPPVPGRTVPLQGPLSDSVADLVRQAGVEALYVHQAEGIAHVLAGRNPVLATPTASGKSLVYNASFLEARLSGPEARALYVFPLKALAQDQLKTFTSLTEPMAEANRPDAATYDGDTGPSERTLIRRRPPAVVFTNPEMIHLSFLAHHQAWKTFFQNLRLVVLDEVHTYRGILGSNMAWVFRRLLRVCSHYGSSPCFVFCSATIANPAELCSSLSGLPVQAVTESTAPSPKKHFLLVNGQGRTSSRALRMLHSALVRQVRTIVYTQSRKMAELISLWAGQRDRSLRRLVSPYRAGFLAEERRSIEDRLSRGKLLAVVSTSALELGIDIGGLDLCLLVGYPGSIMATWQRAGRVGRGDFESATVFI